MSDGMTAAADELIERSLRTDEDEVPITQDPLGYEQILDALHQQIGGDHYRKYGSMQPVQILKRYLSDAEFRGWVKGTAVVYLLREADKGGDQDILKALHTLQLWEELA